MDKKTAKKVGIERNKLRSEYKKLQDKLWKTSFSSSEFTRYQDRMKAISNELDERHVEFQTAFIINFSPDVDVK